MGTVSKVNAMGKRILQAKYLAASESEPENLFWRVARVGSIPDVIDEILAHKIQAEFEDSDKYVMIFGEYSNLARQVMLRRTGVSDYPATVDLADGRLIEVWKAFTELYYESMCNLQFMPATPTLINAGRGGMLSSCFFLRIDDSMESIFDTIKKAAIIMKMGGGVGFDFSEIRPLGSPVQSSNGSATGPISYMKIINSVGDQINQAGIRRSAMMATLRVDHPDILDFIKCKEEEGSLANFNISVFITDEFMAAVESDSSITLHHTKQPQQTIVRARDIWNQLIEHAWRNGEPGVLFSDTIASKDIFKGKLGKLGCNPCLVGNTLVATADGRGAVPIKELAEQGKDVPVYCIDNQRRIVVRRMRNIRRTAISADICKINLDDGSSIRSTLNHKFLTKSGTHKEAKDLKPGDSLEIMTRYQASLDDVIRTGKKRSNDYYWVILGQKNNAEHRLIAEFHAGFNMRNNHSLVVHHKDGNGLNNTANNLEILSKHDHDIKHGKLLCGDNNPMRRIKREYTAEQWSAYRTKMSKRFSGTNNPSFYGMLNDELRSHALSLTGILGRRFTNAEWRDYANVHKLPKAFSSFRKAELGTVSSLSQWASTTLGLSLSNEKVEVIKKIQELSRQGVDCEIISGELYVRKNCSYCKKEKLVPYARRSVCFCDSVCANLFRDNQMKNLIKERLAEYFSNKRSLVRHQQIGVYNELKLELSRIPNKKEWLHKCKEKGISAEMCRKSSPFQTFAQLKERAVLQNHKVVSVERCENEDVYNGTVDDFHNFFVGGFLSKQKNGKGKQVFLNCLNCGELLLYHGESCNLAAVNLSNCVTHGGAVDFFQIAKITDLGIRFLDNVVDLNVYPLPEIARITLATRKIGLGVTGLHDMLLKVKQTYGSDDSIDLIKRIYGTIWDQAVDTSTQLGVVRGVPLELEKIGVARRNAGLLTAQPTGTISQILNQVSTGIEPVFQWIYTRKDTFGSHDMKHFLVDEFGSIENLPPYAKTALEIPPEDHVRVQAAIQSIVDSSVSKTINMPNNATTSDVERVMLQAYENKCKSLTVYRTGSRIKEVLVKKDKKAVVSELAPVQSVRRRPRVLFGATFRMNTPGGKSYITINEDAEGIREVFVHISKAGSEIATHVESSGRLISNSLKYRIPVESLISHLDGQKSNPIFEYGEVIKSVPDAVAKAMREYIGSFEGFSEYIEDSKAAAEARSGARADTSIENMSGGICPECGETLYKESGCETCHSCGHSVCG